MATTLQATTAFTAPPPPTTRPAAVLVAPHQSSLPFSSFVAQLQGCAWMIGLDPTRPRARTNR
ncbi:hypothetical protein SESBI_22867 [Sesbania bispinosa]|nr:hypothetical protein SESBI_22867 [Sesbania bispinosa]